MTFEVIDVLDERNVGSRQVTVLHLDAHADDSGCVALLGMADLETANPARRLISALDLERWLLSLTDEDRLLLALRQAGHTHDEIAETTGKGLTTVRVRLLALGRLLATHAGIEVGTAHAA